MADYLQRFVEDTEKLPSQLHQTLGHMRQLDDQAVALQVTIDEAVRAKILNAAQKAKTAAAHRSKRTKTTPRPAAPLKLDEGLAGDCAQLLALADDKVELARRIYNYVDERIRVTDASLRALDSELNRERRKLGLRDSAVAHLTGGAGQLMDGGSGRDGGKQKKRKREAAAAAAAAIAAAVATPEGSPLLGGSLPVTQSAALPPFNPATSGGISADGIPAATGDEPTYCYCQRVSYGDMIACDNPDCAIEWFHNACVGIKPGSQPKGTWYCRDCAELKRTGKLA